MRALVTGATGYVGGRLAPLLAEAGHSVVCLARTPAKLDEVPWRDQVEVVAGDVTDGASLDPAMAGVDVAYYLVHSIGGTDWAEMDRRAAQTFRDAAAKAGVGRIVYLGGLGDPDDVTDAALSEHLTSRQEVGRILADGPVPVTELRAAVVIGSGSASFEMLRHLVEHLPAMVTPRWVETPCQPVAIRDVLRTLAVVATHPDAAGRILEIGGPDVLTYRQMMDQYASVAGLRRRLIVPVPLLTPKLSSLWIGLVTPVPPSLARPLIDSLVVPVVVTDRAIDEIVPGPWIGYDEAVRLALGRLGSHQVETAWSNADRRPQPAEPMPTDPDWAGGTVLADVRSATTTASPEAAFDAVASIGGDEGWRSPDILWTVRSVLDLAVGGIGRRRGRRHPRRLRTGDTVDFWRVEHVERPTVVRLRAEMKLPGEAWLEWRITPAAGGGATIDQRARFHPRGLWGRLYWYATAPFHALVFPKMLAGTVEAAERTDAETD